MDTEAVLAQILPAVGAILKAVVEDVDAGGEPATLYALEERVQAVLARIGRLVLQGLVDGQGSGAEGAERACACGGAQRYQDQARPLALQTSLGAIRVGRRAYYRCERCGARQHPLDERLGLKGAGRMSRYLQEQVGWLYALLPGEQAQRTLARFGWPRVGLSQLRTHAQALGADLDARERAQGERAREEQGRPPAEQGGPPRPLAGERAYAGPDGVMYCTTARDPQTGRAQWRELKVAAVYGAEPEAPAARPAPAAGDEPPPEAEREVPTRERIARWLAEHWPERAVAPADRARQVSYVATTGPWEEGGRRLGAELWARGLGRTVGEVVVVADGADPIDHLVDAELRLPGVRLTRILDLAHAQQHVWAASRAGHGEGSSAGVAWAQAPLRHLERGEVDALLDALEHLAARVATERPAAAAAVRREATYFATRRAQLDYPAFVAAGYQIGSGLAESTSKRFGTQRMKGAGMRWTEPGAQDTATLRMLLLSDRWDEVSAYCRTAA